MSSQAAELARRLARDAEAVCRHYLSNGRRQGCYWLVGDVANTPGRSLFVRLTGPESGKGAAGKWTDAATAEHGDLLDLIGLSMGLDRLRDVLDEARAFLNLPQSPPDLARPAPAPTGSPEPARRLFAMSRPLRGTIAEKYLRKRGITALHETAALRFHPPLLLPARRRRADRGLAGAHRSSHRPRRHAHRRASDLARPVGQQQGSRRQAEAGDGTSAWARSPIR
jgi:hypothetical protein